MPCGKLAQDGLAGVPGTKHKADFPGGERKVCRHRAENGLAEEQNDQQQAHALLQAEDTPEGLNRGLPSAAPPQTEMRTGIRPRRAAYAKATAR